MFYRYNMKKNYDFFLIIFLFFQFISPLNIAGQDEFINASSKSLSIDKAFMCLSTSDTLGSDTLENESIVFSISQKKVICITSFNNVQEKTIVYHRWYHKDNHVNEKKISVTPINPSINSEMCLRDADKWPWSIEILDQERRLLKILRFSIVD